jgi:hypothetical protein
MWPPLHGPRQGFQPIAATASNNPWAQATAAQGRHLPAAPRRPPHEGGLVLPVVVPAARLSTVLHLPARRHGVAAAGDAHGDEGVAAAQARGPLGPRLAAGAV